MNVLNGYVVMRISAALLIAFGIGGCAKSRALSPAPSGEQVTISVKVPANLMAEPLQVIYRSEKCPVRRSGQGWSTYEVDGYLTDTVHLQQQDQSEFYEAKLPIDRGTKCKWRLSNVTFGVTYSNTKHFGESVEAGPGGGVIVMFDQHLPQIRSVFEPKIQVSGDAIIGGDYYPWLSEQFIGAHTKRAWLISKGEMYSYYVAPNARLVRFEPVLHADYAAHSVVNSDRTSLLTYPDGSVTDGYEPSFKKLQAIRMAAESKE